MKSLLKREYAAALHERIAARHMNAMDVRIETATRNAARAARKRRKEEEVTEKGNLKSILAIAKRDSHRQDFCAEIRPKMHPASQSREVE